MARLKDADNDVILDIMRAMCATAWVIFFLIIKNIVLLVILARERRKHAIYRIPEDEKKFSTGRQAIETADEWDLAGRIQKVLANDTEYVPYFLALLVIVFCTITLTIQGDHQYLARVLGYGIIFVFARYLHTISYLIGNSYGRIIGFLLTVIILFCFSLDHIFFMSKRLQDYIPSNPPLNATISKIKF